MKIAIDTNIVLDVLARRDPFYEKSNQVVRLCATGAAEGALTANALTDIYYVMRKHLDRDALKAALRGLMELFEVIEVTGHDCADALETPMHDFEDSLFACCASRWGADCIVTRNTKDFAHAPLATVAPGDFLKEHFPKG